jgi:hypothetical protein
MKFKSIICVMLISGSLYAQVPFQKSMHSPYVRFGTTFQMWKLDGYLDPLTQISLPSAINIPLGNNFNLNISNTPAFSWWQPATEVLRLDGLSDTWIKGNVLLWDEHILLHAGMGIPSGRTRLDSMEYELVSQGTSRNIYRLNLPIYGQGLTLRGGAAMALPINDKLVIGFGAQYLYRAPYYPLQYTYTYTGRDGTLFEGDLWDESYNPGNEIAAHIGLDLQVGDNLKLMFDGIYTHYGKDVLNDSTQVFGSGDKLAFHFGFYYPLETNYIWGLLTFRQRGKNEILQGGSLSLENVNSNGFQVELDLIGKLYEFTNGGFLVLLDGRYFEKDEYDLREDWTVGGGVGVNYIITPTIQIDLTFKAYYGMMNWERRRSLIGLDSHIGLTVML